MTAEHAPRTDPGTFGTELRRQREVAGLTLQDIIAETKVSRRILEALEGGRFQLLPELVFCKNFVRQYARKVGVEEEGLVRLFEAAWEQFLLASGSHPSLIEAVEEDVPKRRFPWQFWLPVGLGVVVVGVITVLALRGAGQVDELAPSLRQVPAHSIPAPTRFPTLAPSPTTFQPNTGPGDLDNPAPETVGLQVRVRGDQECWVHFRDSNGHTGQQLLTAGEQLDLDLAGPILLTLGNAGASVLRVEGTEYTELGLPGQVLHMEVSRDGLRFLGSGGVDD